MMASNPALTVYVEHPSAKAQYEHYNNAITTIASNSSYLSISYDSGYEVYTTSDGVTFLKTVLGGYVRHLASVNGLMALVSGQTGVQSKKYNGSAWVDCGLPANGASTYLTGTVQYPLNAMGANDKVFSFHDVDGDNTNAVFYTTDGTNWTEIDVPVGGHPIYDPVRYYHKIYYKSGTYYLLSKKVSYYTSTDLVTWTEHKLYNPYNYTVSGMPDINDLFLTSYDAVDAIYFSSGVTLKKVLSESDGLVTSSDAFGSNYFTEYFGLGGGIVIPDIYTSSLRYFTGGNDSAISGTYKPDIASGAIDVGVFNGSIYVATNTLVSALYDSDWTSSDATPIFSVTQPVEKQYFVVDGDSISTITSTVSASGGTTPYQWGGGYISGNEEQATLIYSWPQIKIGGSYNNLYNIQSFSRVGDNIIVYGYNTLSGNLIGVQISPQAIDFSVSDSTEPVANTLSGIWTVYPKLADEESLTSGSLTITTATLSSTVDQAFSGSVGTASGGVPPYTWVLDSKTWADSAALSTAGVLTTTPTIVGSYTLTVTVTDSSAPPQTQTATASFSVADTPYTATIQGTLRLDTSDGAFAARKVYLYDYTTGDKIAETTSDGTTGEWAFTAVAPGEYFVVGAAQGDDLNIPRDFDAMGVITVA